MNNPKFPWMIEDWAGNEIFGTRNGANIELRFQSYEDAEDYLQDILGDAYESDRGKYYIKELRGES